MRPVPNVWCDTLGEAEVWLTAFGAVRSLFDGLSWLALSVWSKV